VVVRASRRSAVAPLALVVLLIAQTATAQPGTRFDVEFTKMGSGAKTEHARIWVSDRRIRVEHRSAGSKSDPHVLIYRGDKDVFLSLDPRRKTYVAVSREMISAFGIESKGARREVQTRLGNLPPDQGRMLVRLIGMREFGKLAAETPVRIVESPLTDTVGAFTCRWRYIERDETRLGEICLADWGDVGIGPKDLEVFRQLANFQRELMGVQALTPLEIVPNQPLDLLVQFDGFPMHFRNLRHSVLHSEIRVTDARRLEQTAGLFEAPADYGVRSAFSWITQLMGGIGSDAPAAVPEK
jgi:hypothetical protein